VFSPSIFFFSSIREKKTIEKKKYAKKGGSLPSSSRFALSFLALASALSFQAFSPGIFFFSNIRKKKHKKKTHRKEKICREGRELTFLLLLLHLG